MGRWQLAATRAEPERGPKLSYLLGDASRARFQGRQYPQGCLGEPDFVFLAQDEELLGHIQGAILQVQGDCEKLNVTTSSLIEDHRQKQKDIDVRGGGAAGGPRHSPGSLLLILCALGLPAVVPGTGEAGEGKGQPGTPGDGD